MVEKTTLDLWNEFKETPPSVTKAFKRSGGFSGKAIDPLYIIRRLTEKFGPIGTGWGFEILDEAYINGAPFKEQNGPGHTIIHKIRLHIWYIDDNDMAANVKCFTGPQFGLTTFVGEYASGPFTDEEHAKKSVTDAIGKCAVLLGLAADVHMGLHDDNKYVNDLREKLNKKGREGSEKISDPVGDNSTEKPPPSNPPVDTSKVKEGNLIDHLGESPKIKKQKAGVLYAKLKAIVKKEAWSEEDELSFMDDIGFDSMYVVTESKFESINKLLSEKLGK